jgi:hypothetical protein
MRDDRVYPSKTWFRTKVAKPEDLYVGRRIIYTQREIKRREDLEDFETWSYGRIINIGDADKGTVIVARSDTPDAELAKGVRVIVGGDPDPKLELTGKEDPQYFHPEHWLVFTGKGEPGADGFDAKMALAVTAPAKPGEAGTFLRLDTDDLITTKHAVRTRQATKADLKAGLEVALFERGEPPHREAAYAYTWWVGKLTSVDHGYPKVGNHSVSLSGMRVVLR